MKNLFILTIFLQIAKIFTQNGVDQTAKQAPIDPFPVDPILYCTATDQATCEKDSRCWWDPTLYCSNKVECNQLPLKKCLFTKGCHITPETPGYCSSFQISCQSYNKKQCLFHPFCHWIASYTCEYSDPFPVQPDCSIFNPKQCLKNSEFCNLNGQCYDNKGYCSGLDLNQCKSDPACQYTFTQKEQCLDNDNFCKGLNEKQCLKNNKFCLGLYTAPQCVNQFNCDGLNQQQCKDNSQYCTSVSTPSSCAQRKGICSQYTNAAACSNAGCFGSITIGGVFTCYNPYPCNQFDDATCKANDKFCVFTPGTFTCKNNVDCTSITDPGLCQENKYCKFIPSQFNCIPKKQQCQSLQGVDCMNNPACTYVAPQGYCSQISSFGCNSLSLLECQQNQHCLLKYQCTPKKLPPCNALTLDQCKKSSYCHLVDHGHCFNDHINCDLPYEDCIRTRPCLWSPGTKAQCTNDIDCDGLNEKQCAKNDVYCSLKVGGCKGKIK